MTIEEILRKLTTKELTRIIRIVEIEKRRIRNK